MNLNSPIRVAAAKGQEELTGGMEGGSNDQMYVGQKCQDMTEGREETGRLEETSFAESELKEKKEGCRNPFSNVPFPSTKKKELSKVVLNSNCEATDSSYYNPILSGVEEERYLDEVSRIHMAW